MAYMALRISVRATVMNFRAIIYYHRVNLADDLRGIFHERWKRKAKYAGILEHQKRLLVLEDIRVDGRPERN